MSQKKLKFLVDIGVSKKVEEWFLRNGYDLKAVRDINPKMEDDKMLSIAISENRIVVTMDKNFGEIFYSCIQIL